MAYNERVVASTPVLTTEQCRHLKRIQNKEKDLKEQIQLLQDEYESLEVHTYSITIVPGLFIICFRFATFRGRTLTKQLTPITAGLLFTQPLLTFTNTQRKSMTFFFSLMFLFSFVNI